MTHVVEQQSHARTLAGSGGSTPPPNRPAAADSPDDFCPRCDTLGSSARCTCGGATLQPFGVPMFGYQPRGVE